MRARAYVRILAAATLLVLVATTISPDVNAPFFKFPGESQPVRDLEQRVFHWIVWPPQVVARAFGIWIDSHSAQLWPKGWPIFMAFATRVILISVPFWFVAGVLGYELVRLILQWQPKRVADGVQRESG